MDHIENSEIKTKPLYQGLMGCAVVAAVFSTITIILLLLTGYRIYITDPARADQLFKMKEQMQIRPADEALAQQIRTFDAGLRADELRRQHFVEMGGLYLAGGLIVAAGCFFAARAMLRPAPIVPTSETSASEQIERAMRVRFAVTIATVILGALGLFAALSAKPKSKPAEIVQVPKVQWSQAVQGQWPSFRGPWGTGVVKCKEVPDTWNEKQNSGILWKSEVVLNGHGSPIAWNDKVFIAGATQKEQKLFCYDAKDGKLLWTGQIQPAGTEGREMPEIMEDTSYAASTPVTNGNFVCAIFASGDIGCFDMEGKVKWQKALGIPESSYGYASSPAVFDDLAIVQFDQGSEEGKSELIAITMADGEFAWRTKRPTPNTWTSPTVARTDKGYQILTSGSPWVIGYQPSNGNELWRVECLGSDIAPTQILAGGLVCAIQPYDKIYGIKIDNAGGTVTAAAKVWETQGDMPDIASPVSDGKVVWTLTTGGGLTCFDLADGSSVYTQSLEGEFQASPSLVRDKLYIQAASGEMIIAQAGREYREIKRCSVEGKCFASPAFTERRIYIRTEKHLYCIGKP